MTPRARGKIECADSSRTVAFQSPTMKRFAGALAGFVAVFAATNDVDRAYAAELVLRPARELAPPATKTPVLPTTPAARPAARGAPTQKPEAEPPRGVVFLRADRLEGDQDKVTAEGNVELRSRYETVLAPWPTNHRTNT